MGLAERRALLEFQNDQLPALQARIEQAAGCPVTLEVDWDSIAPEGESLLYGESWPAVYFEPLIAALQAITSDELGRTAVQATLKTVVIRNLKANYYADGWAALEQGVLTLDHEPLTNIADVAARTEALIGVLERAL